MKKLLISLVSLAGLSSCGLFGTAPSVTLFERDFNSSNEKNCLDGISIYEGNFGFKKLGEERCLQSSVMEAFQGFMFGPDNLDEVEVQADFYAYLTEAAMPTFGLGTHGSKGPRLIACQNQTHPELRLILGQEQFLGSHPFSLKPQAWHTMRFVTSRMPNGFLRCRGRIWPRGSPEPKHWMIDIQLDGELKSGQTSAWVVTFNRFPVFIDNIKSVKK
ncbi:MAG: outer membrane protein assembly factor BamB [Verrucomicrobiota bacterium]|jgi:hypothetical protein